VQLTIDSSEPLERVLPVVAALYGVELTVSAAPVVVPRQRASSGPPRGAARPRKAPDRSRAAGPRRRQRSKPDPATVRRWARANGHEVKDRGRVPDAVISAYLAS
jgi:hypothetical protein